MGQLRAGGRPVAVAGVVEHDRLGLALVNVPGHLTVQGLQYHVEVGHIRVLILELFPYTDVL